MANLVEIKKITLVSKTNQKHKFDVNLLCKLSNFIKNIIEDNDELNFPMHNFTDEDLYLLNDYIIFIKNSEYDFNRKNNTVNYYYNFHNYNNNAIIRSYLEKLSKEKIKRSFEISRYFDINFLQEEIIRYNIQNIIKSKKNKIEELNTLIFHTKKNLKTIKNEKEEFKSENKLENYYSGDEDSNEEEEVEEELDKKEQDEELVFKYKSVVIFEKELSKFNNDIKNSKDKLLKEYINIMKLYSKKSQFLTDLVEKKEQELNNINNELVVEVNDYITNSQNKFYIGNAYCCIDCLNLSFITDVKDNIDEVNEIIKKCYQCEENISYSLEMINHDINHILIKQGYTPESNDDKEAYEDSEMENINNMIDIKNNIINNNYSSESEMLLKKCIECNFKNKEFLDCGKTDDFGNSLKKLCCQETFCEEHFGTNKVRCSHKNCNYIIDVCEECYPINRPDRYHSYSSECTDLFCNYCDELFCKYHMKDEFCRNHAYYDRD
jgi:hypothetical protein